MEGKGELRMYEKIPEQYGITPEYKFNLNGFEAFESNGYTFIISSSDLPDEEILETKQFSDFLSNQGYGLAATLIPTINNNLSVTMEGRKVALYHLPYQRPQYKSRQGTHLAQFHHLGLQYQSITEYRNRLGQWETLWANRLEQLESWCSKRFDQISQSSFERKLLETFPYFLGLSENAIQYVADSKWEDHIGEKNNGTICHVKFQPQTDIETVVLPDQWIYDHPTRDIAEWVRSTYWSSENNSFPKLIEFLNDYERIVPLSIFSWRMLLGRLMFPLHYFEVVEHYYTSQTDQEREIAINKFNNIIETSNDYEVFLSNFYKEVGLPVERLSIHTVDWLKV